MAFSKFFDLGYTRLLNSEDIEKYFSCYRQVNISVSEYLYYERIKVFYRDSYAHSLENEYINLREMDLENLPNNDFCWHFVELVKLMLRIREKYWEADDRNYQRYLAHLLSIVFSMPPSWWKIFNIELLNRPKSLPYKNLRQNLWNTGKLLDVSSLITNFRKQQKDWITQEMPKLGDVYHSIFQKEKENNVVEQGQSITSQSFSDRLDCIVQKLHIFRDVENKVIEQLFFFSPTVTHSLDASVPAQLTTLASDIFGLVSELIDQMTNSLKMCVAETVKSIKGLASFILVCFIIGALSTIHSASFKKLILIVISLLVGKDLFNFIRKYFFLEEQSGSNTPSFLFPLLLNQFFQVPVSLMQSKNIMGAMRFLALVPRSVTGVENIIGWAQEIFSLSLRFFKRNVLGIDPEVEVTGENHPVVAWIEELKDLLNRYYAGTFVYSELSFALVHSLYVKGLTFQRSIAYRSDLPAINSLVRDLTKILENFRIKGFNDNGQIRNPPVTLYMYGDTGSGKSTLTYPLVACVLKEICNDLDLMANWKNLVYSRNCEQEYWDGYTGQLVTVFDDFAQMVDTSANPNLELFEIIRAGNVFPYPLHMATLEEKARTNFSSKIIIASSNQITPKTQSLNFPAAMLRRFDISIKVTRKPGFEVVEGDKFLPEIYKFEQYNILTNKSIGEITWKQLVNLMTRKYLDRQTFVSSINSFIEDTLSAPSIRRPHTDFRFVQEQGFDFLSYFKKINVFDQLKKSVVKFESKNCCAQQLQYLKNTYPFLKHTKIVLGILGLLGSIFFSYKVIKKMFPSPVKAENESYNEPVVKQIKIEGYSAPVVSKIKVEASGVKFLRSTDGSSVSQELLNLEEEIVEQGVLDRNAAEICTKLITKNLYKMYCSESGKHYGHILFLKGRVALFPFHYVHQLKNNVQGKVSFRSVFGASQFTSSVENILQTVQVYESNEDITVLSRDMCSMVIGNASLHADITSCFVERKDISSVVKSSVLLPLIHSNELNSRGFAVIKFSKTMSGLQTKDLEIDTQAGGKRKIRQAWEYCLDTDVGDCGAPLLIRNTSVTSGKIVGMHVAGIPCTGLGYSTPIYKEDIIKILESHTRVNLITLEQCESVSFPRVTHIPSSPEFTPLYMVKNFPKQPTKSKIFPSKLHGLIQEPKTALTLLRRVEINGEVKDPMGNRLKKFSSPHQDISQALIDNAVNAFSDHLVELINNRQDFFSLNDKASYTFEEAVLGVQNEPFLNSIKRNSSPGYPFVLNANTSSKWKIFGNGMDLDVNTQEAKLLKDRVNLIRENALNNVAMQHVFMDTLKDERKPLGKQFNTRMFSACPLDYLIACKMSLMGVVSQLSKVRNDCHISVGTNVYSNDWDRIATLLLRKSQFIVAGDFEGFDSSESVAMLRGCVTVLRALLKNLGASDQELQIFDVLMEGLLNSSHINSGVVYQWLKGLPSGHYLTAIINSIFVNLSFCVVWQKAFNKHSYYWARMFWEECGIVAYGDDHLVSIPKQYLDKFNQHTLVSLFAEIGLIYTDEDKSNVAAKFRSLDEVSYLKRRFVFDIERKRMLCPLNLISVLEAPMWTKELKDQETQLQQVCDFSLKELSLHHESVWDMWAPKLISLMSTKLSYETPLKELRVVRDLALQLEEIL